MATTAEKTLVQHFTIERSLRALVVDGLPPDCMSSPDLQEIQRFAFDYFHAPDTPEAPGPNILKVHFANVLAEHEIDVDSEPEGTLEWAVEAVKCAYFDRHWQTWTRTFAEQMSTASLLDKPVALSAALDALMGIQSSFTRRSERVDLRDGLESRLDAYEQRRRDREADVVRGIRFGHGLDMVDSHVGGIRDGELAVMAGGPKSGKSYMLAWSAYHHWRAGGVPVLMTLENSTEMTLDRIACMALALDPRAFQRGTLSDAQVASIRTLVEEMGSHEHPFWIVQPEPGKRTAEAMVREAKNRGDALYVDQLTFVDHTKRSDRSDRHIQIRDILHDLKASISSGKRIPCMLAHQINREGMKAAEKSGRLEMYHMAEGSEVERTADWVFGLW